MSGDCKYYDQKTRYSLEIGYEYRIFFLPNTIDFYSFNYNLWQSCPYSPLMLSFKLELLIKASKFHILFSIPNRNLLVLLVAYWKWADYFFIKTISFFSSYYFFLLFDR